MNTKAIIFTLALGASTGLLMAQDQRQFPGHPGGPAYGGQRPQAPGQHPGGGPGGMGQQRPPMPLIEALDLNKDGTLDASEIARASESLKKLDQNKDGKLAPEEYHPQHPGGPNGPGEPDAQRRGGAPARGGDIGEGRSQRPALD